MNTNMLTLLFLIAFSSIQSQNSDIDKKATFFNQTLPNDSAVLFAEGIVSYPFMNHSSVTISKNMDEMYWSKWYDDEGREEIVFSKILNGIWTEPGKVSFSGIYSDDVPVLSPDGERLYFVSRRPKQKGLTSSKENIWYVNRQSDGNWSLPIAVSEIINSGQLHWQISVSNDKNIYFSTNEGIKLSKFENGKYQKPEPITEILNPLYEGGLPHISPNEDYIIFATGKLKDSFGSNDLYIGFKDKQEKWCNPINLGNKINGSKGEMCPYLSPDERFLFFVKYDDVFDIYWVKADFIMELNPFK